MSARTCDVCDRTADCVRTVATASGEVSVCCRCLNQGTACDVCEAPNPRERGEDDGVEYGDPRDELVARLASLTTGAALLAWIAASTYLWWAVLTQWTPIAGGDAVRPVVIDALLFAGFALHHSLAARLQVGRTGYVWGASVLLAGVVYGWQPVPGVLWTLGAWGWLGWAAGALLTGMALAQLGLGLAGAPVPVTTAGLYRWVRHPLYTGWLLLVWSVPEMTGTRFVWALVSTGYLVVALPFEERALHRDPAYRAYAQTVRWKLIPGVW